MTRRPSRSGLSALGAERRAGLTRPRAAYFEGNVAAIDAIQVETASPAFQRTLWRTLRDTSTGATMTHGAMALSLGSLGAAQQGIPQHTIRDFAVQFVRDEVFGSDSGRRAEGLP